MKISAILLCGICLFSIGDRVSMSGIKINDSDTILEKIDLDIIATESEGKTMIRKYRTKNGNDLSVTTLEKRVAFLENDWLQDSNSRDPLITDFSFGQTTLRDIRTVFGTNGFTYKNMYYVLTETDIMMFNCFEVESPQDEILVCITKVSLSADVTEANIADNLKLEALILSTDEYLETLWGSSKLYDQNYKKVKL